MIQMMKLAVVTLVLVFAFLALTSQARTLLDYDGCYNGIFDVF